MKIEGGHAKNQGARGGRGGMWNRWREILEELAILNKLLLAITLAYTIYPSLIDLLDK